MSQAPGLGVIKLEYSLRLKIKPNDWQIGFCLMNPLWLNLWLSIDLSERYEPFSFYFATGYYFSLTFHSLGLGAKSQILSSVAPPRKKKLVSIFSQGHVWGPQKLMFY